MMVVVPGSRHKLRRSLLYLLFREETPILDEGLERGQPVPIVVPHLAFVLLGSFPVTDLRDEPPSKLFPVKMPPFVQRDRHTERLALPRRFEYQLSVFPGEGSGATHVGDQSLCLRPAAPLDAPVTEARDNS